MITQNLHPHCPNKPDPSICATCASQSHTCCYVSPGNEDYCFPISKAEQNRILTQCGQELAGAEFFAISHNTPEFLSAMHNLFPEEKNILNKLFPKGKKHFRLATLNTGFCVFLGKLGCVLPRDVRPWFCKLFPFWVQNGEITAFTASYCLIAKGAISPTGMLNIMGQNPDEVLSIFNKLRHDWGLVPATPGIKLGK